MYHLFLMYTSWCLPPVKWLCIFLMEVSAAGIWQLGPKGLQMNRLSCFTHVALQALHWSCACFCVLLFGLELSLGLGLYTCTTLKRCSN